MKNHQYHIVLFISLLLFVSCAAPTPTPIPPTPTITPSPAPTNTPTPTPTPTPIPPLSLNFNWPESVPALPPVPIEVELIPPPGITPQASVYAKVVDPEGNTFQEFTLAQGSDNRYAANPGLQLPLFPKEGNWRITLQIETSLDVEGKREFYFQATPPQFRTLTGTLPSEIMVQIPEAFEEILSQGDQWAGAQVWRYEDGEIGLWWAPGPTEELLYNTAIVMLEATQDLDQPPEVLSYEETIWGEYTAFLFEESWPGVEHGPAKAWVIQGDSNWLYVLRLRGVGAEVIPEIIQEAGETLTLQ